ncbi:rhodanese-like domain-containing protein [Cohnella sp. AR92]|uniref:rhodanese-like domain-containing protein n=1 Tax=Cohnella sp. AR92 TaxID=648716 RepID=UPI000F8F1A39|nr:rhodanese-like domain-containing protein [Cohnella sp. AR92]RUS45072.1 rhodanese-like domain-containing protein [Cohnella sp. AR92]
MSTSNIVTIVAAVLLIVFLYSRMKPAKGLRNLRASEFKEELAKKRVLIDVREPGEFKSGHIPGARNVPLSQLQGRLGDIPKGQPVLLYCRSGMRSKTAARLLLRSGYSELAHLQGGLGGWNGELTRR